MPYPGSGSYPGETWPGPIGSSVDAPTFFSGSPARLAVSVTHADGRVSRWGFDENDPRDIPASITFGTSMPGGFKTASLTLPRRIDRDYPDLNLFDNIRIYGPGGETAWEGRVAQLPLQHDASSSVTVQAVGHAAHLSDSPFSMVYVDRDLSGWGDMATQRRKNVIDAGYALGSFTATPDTATGYPAIVTTITGAWATPVDVEAWYDAGPANLIGTIYYDFIKGTNTNAADTNWTWVIVAASDDIGTAQIPTGQLRAASGSGYYTPASTYRYLFLQQLYAAAAGGAGVAYDVIWRKLAVYGNHGLTRRGSDPGGFYASDVIADIVSRAAPLLSYTTESIEATSFVIPHLAFREQTTAEDAITLVNGYHLYEWGVWEDREFFWRQPSADRLTWQARLSDGARVELEGEDANNIFNGVVVQYTDPSGAVHTVGPLGSGHEATDSSLADTSPTNPVNAHGIPRRWGLLQISQPTTQAAAIQLGAVWLIEHSRPQRRGNLTLSGYAHHPTKGRRPVHEIRAGDWITIADRPSDVARRVIETSYTHDQRTVSCSLDNTTLRLDAIMERLGVALVGVL